MLNMLLIFLLGSQFSSGLEEMYPVLNMKDADRFRGKIVLFSSDSIRFHEDNGYKTDPESDLKEGIVGSVGEKGYVFARLLNNDKMDMDFNLNDENLVDANLKMREVTPEEREKVGRKILGKEKEMYLVLNERDAARFGGKMVAFSLDCSQEDNGYVIDPEGNLKVGFVSEQFGQKGHRFYRLLNNDEIHGGFELDDEILADANLKMREVTP